MSDQTQLPAKRPAFGAAGPYGHPFHPLLVTLPIGAWVSSLIFDIVARAGNDETVFSRGAYWLIGIGIIGAAVAAVFGLMDLLTIPQGTMAKRTALTHMTLNVVVLVLFIVSYLLRRSDGGETAETTPFILSIIALVLLAVSGWLGGRMAYRYGVRVADERTQAQAYR
jgi:uncharacterized membrane protein